MTFPVHFFICNLYISLLLMILLFLKKVWKRHITLRTQYRLWYLFVLALLLPFLPFGIFSDEFTSEKLYILIQQLLSQASSHAVSVLAENISLPPSATDWLMTDFSTAIASPHSLLYTVLCGIWITGMVLAALFFIYTIAKIYYLRKTAYPVTEQTEPELYHQYASCLQELHIKRKVQLYASCHLSSPVSYGWLLPKVMIPQDLDILLSEEDIRFIFLHELQHYKHKDALLNDLVCLLQIVYWFNPAVWYGFRQLRKDQEIACDNSVIRVIGKNQCLDYGYTIIKYAEQMKKNMFLSPLSSIGGSKNAIKQRILEIADYKKDSVFQKIKSTGIFLLILLLVYYFSPLFTAYASVNSSFRLKSERCTSIDVRSCFEGADGAFVLYDMENDQYQIYNPKQSAQRISPDSTFKIYSGLFALEEQIISPDDSLQKWDGTEQLFDAWNKDCILNTAMQDSVNWYFQNLDRQMGLLTLASYYHKISYGNCDLTGGIENYWAESSLKISPVEQVILLKDLLQNKWGFQEQNIEAIKEALFVSNTTLGKLYGKTGTGLLNGQNTNGWFVGFLEHHGNTYCFAVNLQDSDASGLKALEITQKILNSLLPFR